MPRTARALHRASCRDLLIPAESGTRVEILCVSADEALQLPPSCCLYRSVMDPDDDRDARSRRFSDLQGQEITAYLFHEDRPTEKWFETYRELVPEFAKAGLHLDNRGFFVGSDEKSVD